MLKRYIEDNITYDGTQLSSLWAFNQFSLQGDSIVAFRGPCNVPLEHMVDQADVLARESIFSREMLHFIVEHFDNDLEKTVYRQRLLICILHEVISDQITENITRQGDDLYLGKRKLSVSIATASPVSTLIHTGLNIISEGAPVAAVSLPELGITDLKAFALEVMERYTGEMESCALARCKVRGVP